VHNATGKPDILASLDNLNSSAPAVQNVSLVVSWFGFDLRAGNCQMKPGVETATKTTAPKTWGVNGVTRSGAHLISTDGQGKVNYGGTPADFSVVQLHDLCAVCPLDFLEAVEVHRTHHRRADRRGLYRHDA